jgi:putative nucleotidyltransferase with HDIG domain
VLLSTVVHVTAGLPLGYGPCGNSLRDVVFLQFLYVGISAIGYVLLVRVGELSLVLLIVPLLVARQSLLTVQNRQEAFDRMVGTFVAAIQAKDGYTRGHAERVSDLSVLVAERMGLSYDERQLIRYGAILHDVGKIGVSIGVLCKAGPLTDDEFGEMKQHPEIGAEMLSDIDFLKPALAIVEHHHERLDGRGYPAGLEGDDIPLLTRIVTAVDAFDAMTSTRPYRRALPVSVAIEELTANAGSQFCPRVVEHLVAVIAEEGWELTDVPVHAIPVAETP